LSREFARVGNNDKVFLFGHSMVRTCIVCVKLTRVVDGRGFTGFRKGGGIVFQYACTLSTARPSLGKLAGIISSSPITVQPPDTRVSRALLYSGAMLGKVLPSLQMKIDIKGTVGHSTAIQTI
jgi:hypothetical protein